MEDVSRRTSRRNATRSNCTRSCRLNPALLACAKVARQHTARGLPGTRKKAQMLVTFDLLCARHTELFGNARHVSRVTPKHPTGLVSRFLCCLGEPRPRLGHEVPVGTFSRRAWAAERTRTSYRCHLSLCYQIVLQLLPGRRLFANVAGLASVGGSGKGVPKSQCCWTYFQQRSQHRCALPVLLVLRQRFWHRYAVVVSVAGLPSMRG